MSRTVSTATVMTVSHPSGSEPAGAKSRSSSFELLAEPVRRWIWRKQWTGLRGVQEQAIPVVIGSDSDVVIAAATASGKTEAAFLPLISKAVASPKPQAGFRLLYVSPLKALINDQFGRLRDLCESLQIPVHPWHGDISASKKSKARKTPDGILLITPESLEALFVLRGLELTQMFQGLEAVIVDELHAFLGSERGRHLSSLLTRLEGSVGHPVRRIGLSATLGDMSLACEWLRRDAAENIAVIVDRSDGGELQLQIKGMVQALPSDDLKEDGAKEHEELVDGEPVGNTSRQIAEHLFAQLRGEWHLIFAGSRQRVEEFSDLMLQLSEQARLPNEFFPHHSNLSRDHREFLEHRLKDGRLPTTAICTSTLELGIDIGDVKSVAQIGAPGSVASLRQRLGRSGRRPGQPAILRGYVVERDQGTESGVCDRLRLRLAQSVAVIELLISGWCEPPPQQALHLSTLVHQVLSVIAQRGGARARDLYLLLCRHGPFSNVSQDLFARLLKQIGGPDVSLIEQSTDGLLLLGREGEMLVEHYSFYAVFQTPEEYRIESAERHLGTLPIMHVLAVGMTIIFSGRRWRIVEVHDREKTIRVIPDPSGVPPSFGGEGEALHDGVAEQMRQVLSGSAVPAYLDRQAQALLLEGRSWFEKLGLRVSSLISNDDGGTTVFPWQGTVAVQTLMLAMRSHSLDVSISAASPIVLECDNAFDNVESVLRDLACSRPPDGLWLAQLMGNLEVEKYHRHLSRDLLAEDAASSRIQAHRVPELAGSVLSSGAAV